MIPNRVKMDNAIATMRLVQDGKQITLLAMSDITDCLQAFLPWAGGLTGKVYGDDCDDCIRPDAGCGACIIHDTYEGDEILIKPRR